MSDPQHRHRRGVLYQTRLTVLPGMPLFGFTARGLEVPVEPKMSLSATTQSELERASSSVISEVEAWEPDHWSVACEVHKEPSNGLRLAFHVASRSRRVLRAITEQPGSELDVSQVHIDPTPVPQDPNAVVATLKAARDEAQAFLAGLDDAEIERLHAAVIDGEPDGLMATCGLIGHWTFHLPAIQQIRGPARTRVD